jgi:hypothetical protein
VAGIGGRDRLTPQEGADRRSADGVVLVTIEGVAQINEVTSKQASGSRGFDIKQTPHGGQLASNRHKI